MAAHDQDRGINAPVTYSVRASPSPADNNTALVRLHKDSGELSVTGDLLRASLPTTIVIQVRDKYSGTGRSRQKIIKTTESRIPGSSSLAVAATINII